MGSPQDNGWLVAANDQFKNAKQSLIYAIKALEYVNGDFSSSIYEIKSTIGDLDVCINKIDNFIIANASGEQDPQTDIDIIKKALAGIPENKKLVMSLENVETLIKDASKFFSPTHNFDGEKEAWLKKAGLWT